MTPEKVTMVKLSELSEIVVICGKCKTEITLPVEAKPPEGCPSCQELFDGRVDASISAFSRMHREGRASSSKILFRLKESLNQEKQKE